MQDAAAARSCPIVDYTKIDLYKQFFVRCAREICPGYIIREDQKKMLNSLFRWCIMDYTGELDPERGLLLWGDIGVGKSTLLQIVRLFCNRIRPMVNGQRYSFRITNVIDICARFSDESRDGGYNGIQTYISSARQAFDELGSETTPTGRWGNFENVMQYILQKRYDMRDANFTHATTNLSMAQLSELYSPRIYDRCKEMFNFVEIKGNTFRKKYESRQIVEQKQTEQKDEKTTEPKGKVCQKTGRRKQSTTKKH